MTLKTNARLAGFAFLIYIAAGITAMIVTSGNTTLEAVARHAVNVRAGYVLELIGCFSALVLAVTLYSITRGEDPELAMLALTCRVAEGILGAAAVQRSLGLLWLATTVGSSMPDSDTTQTLGTYLLKAPGGGMVFGGTFFAVGSTLFSYLLLRGRLIPAPLAWLGVIASVLLVVVLPLDLAGVLSGVVTQIVWLPMAAFEIIVAFWFIIKGVAPSSGNVH